MLKNILLSGLLCASAYAQSLPEKALAFDVFLQRAMENSPYLKSSALGIAQAKEEGAAITRYMNPSLGLEYSRFRPQLRDSENGVRVNFSQPIRLWGVGDDKERLSAAALHSASAEFKQKKAGFIRDISLFYTRYSQQKMLLSLGAEELRIAKTIYAISKARYEEGTISRGVMLQAQVAYEMIQIRNESLSLTAMQSYYDLLKRAGINQELELDAEHKFVIKEVPNTAQNPDVLNLHGVQEKALSQAAVDSNAIEWMRLYAEYENEPEQDITRVGVNFPLAIFNTKSQEKQIARLEADKTDLLIQNKKTQLDIEKNRLHKQMQTLVRLKDQNEKVLETELELLQMFEEGYKIASINLLELHDVKNKVIETKERLIQIKTALNQNAITTNYIQGSYNE